jgi:Ser/Thr protein kinase RdoA (MazF antagonist)
MSAHFPVSYSTLSAPALAALIEKTYSLTQATCSLILRGVGDTYEVNTTTGKYILRVYRPTHRSLAQIQEEVDLLCTLSVENVSVAAPMAATDGTYIIAINAPEGTRHAILFQYAPGIVLNSFKPSQAIALGREIAQFHNVSDRYTLAAHRWSFDLTTTLYTPIRQLTPFLDSDSLAWITQTAEMVKARLAAVDTSVFSTGLCHFDLLPKNFHFDGDKVTLFDFDFMGHGWLVNDLMTFKQQLWLDVLMGRLTSEDAATTFATVIKGYREVRAISDEELSVIPLLAPGFWLFYSGFHTTHDQFLPFIQPAHLTQRISMLRRLFAPYLSLVGI